MGDVIETPGMTFLKKLELAKENKTTLFAFLYQSLQKIHKSEDINQQLDEVSSLDAMAKYYGALAEFQIKRNEEAIQNSQRQLVGLHILGENNFDYEIVAQRRVAVLSSLKPESKDCIYLAMKSYIKDKSYGSATDFKREFKNYTEQTKQMLNQQKVMDY